MTRRQTLLAERRIAWPGPATWAVIAAGVMMTTALPPTHGTGVLAPVALALLFYVLRDAPRPGRAAWSFGLAHQTTLLYWLFFLDPAKSIPTRALVPIQAVATILYCALYYLLFGWLAGRVRRRLGATVALVAMPALWVAVELLRLVGEMGFPWCLAGSAWIDSPLMPLYAAAGEMGLSCATALTGAALVAVAGPRRGVPDDARRARVALVVAAVVGWLGLAAGASVGGGKPLPAGWRTTPLRVAVIQPDVSLSDKWDDAKTDSTTVPYSELTRRAAGAGAELVVWAETAVPAYLRYDRALMDWLRDLARATAVPIYLGFPDAVREPDGVFRKYNSSGLFSAYGTLLEQYAKHHLLPIGEVMPFERYAPFLGKIDVGQAEWSPGEAPGPIRMQTNAGDFPFAGLICYEAIFGDLARQAVRRGAGCLVNITNDGWFGETAGPLQHAALSRIRAVECGVPLVRCANNGVSFVCGPDGRPVASLGLHRRGILVEPVTLRVGDTLYVRAGAWPALIYLLIATGIGVVLARPRRLR
jgi:apolipoprotein N-acyltransferase